MKAGRSPKAMAFVAKRMIRHFRDVALHGSTQSIVRGRALIARLARTLTDDGVPFWLESPATSLIEENGQVVGARLNTPDGEVEVRARHGVVLAGGASKRMGKINKLLAEVDGTVLVRQVAAAAIESDAAEVIVVTGHEADLVRETLSDFDVRFVHNPHYPEGLSTSLRAGIGAVSEYLTGAVVLLGDMPRVTAATVNALIERFHADYNKTICQPTFDGRPGNPILWPREFFSDILDIWGDTGARRLIERYSERVSKVEVDDADLRRLGRSTQAPAEQQDGRDENRQSL